MTDAEIKAALEKVQSLSPRKQAGLDGQQVTFPSLRERQEYARWKEAELSTGAPKGGRISRGSGW